MLTTEPDRFVGLTPSPAMANPVEAPDNDVLGASSRQFNMMRQLYDYQNNRQGLVDDPNYNPLDDVRGTKYEGNLDDFIGSRSRAETQVIMREKDTKDRDMAFLGKAGWAGAVAMMGMGIADPTIAMPIFDGFGIAKGAMGILKASASLAATSAAQAGIQQSVAYATGHSSGEEAAMNIGTATLLGGMLGGAIKFLAPAERAALEKSFENDRVEMGHDIALQHGVSPEAQAEQVKTAEIIKSEVLDGTASEPKAPLKGDALPSEKAPREMAAKASEEASIRASKEIPNTEPMLHSEITVEYPKTMSGYSDSIAGATASDTRKLELQSFAGLEKIPGIGAAFNALGSVGRIFTSPTLRTFMKPFISARRAMADLAETPLQFVDNKEGVATTANGPALDRMAKIHIDGTRVAVGNKIDQLYASYRTGSTDLNYVGQQVQKIKGGLGMQAPMAGAKMKPLEFHEAIGNALANGDKSEIPQVAEAAQFIRENVFNKWKQRAIDAGLFKADGEQGTAESYMMRVWNKEKINAQRPILQKIISDWLGADQAAKSELKNTISSAMQERTAKEAAIEKLSTRIEVAAHRMDQVEAQLGERQMEATATEKRFDTVSSRQETAQANLDQIRTFISDFKEANNSPEIAAHVKSLEAEAAKLEKGIKDITEKDLEAQDNQQRSAVMVGPMRRVARIMTGKGSMPKAAEPFWKYIARMGGVSDTGGDLRSMLGEPVKDGAGKVIGRQIDKKSPLQRLFKKGGKQWDDLQSHLASEFPEIKDRYGWNERKLSEDYSDEIRQAIADSAAGKEPAWYQAAHNPTEDDQFVTETVGELDRLVQEGVLPKFKTTKEVGDFLSGHGEGDYGMTVADYDKIISEMEAGPMSMLNRSEAQGLRNQADTKRASLDILKETLIKARDTRARAMTAEGKSSVRVNEAGMAFERSMRRADLLDERSTMLSDHVQALTDARAKMAEDIEALRAKQEKALKEWKGDTSTQAIKSLAKRDAAEAARQEKMANGAYAGKGERLKSADSDVDSALESIIKSDRDLDPETLHSRAGEIIDRIVGTPDGRLAYDAPSGGPQSGWTPDSGPPTRGPLAYRNFMIPDELVKDYLDRDARQVTQHFMHSVVPDVLMTERFGDVNMKDAFDNLRQEHEKLALAAPDEASRVKLKAQYDEAVTDLAGVRDRIKGVYAFSSDAMMQKTGRIISNIKKYNTTTNLGGSALSSLPDMAGTILLHGFPSTIKNGWTPYIKMLSGNGAEWEAAKEQFHALGLACETQLATRFHEMQDIASAYRPTGKFSRVIDSAAETFHVASGLTLWTDVNKTVAGMTAQAEALKAIKAVVEGNATQRQITRLATNNVDQEMAHRIWQNFNAPGGGKVVGTSHFPITEAWTDGAARDTYNGLIARDMDISVVTPGQEKPLWLSKPITSLIGEYKSFVAGSTERLLMTSLQQADFNTLQGIIASVGLGMMAAKAYSMVTGFPEPTTPQGWLKEGIHRSGIDGWFGEGNAIMAKATGGTVDVYRLIGADQPLSRYQSRSVLGALLGPSLDKVNTIIESSGALGRGDWNAGNTHNVRRAIAGQNLIWLRGAMDHGESAFNSAIGVPDRAQRTN